MPQDAGSVSPRLMLTDHKAAVKALDWCPSKRGLLASGGESADRCIKFWDSSTGKMKRSIDRLSDFVAIVWSKSSDELCSAHGYAENPLIVWDYDNEQAAGIEGAQGSSSYWFLGKECLVLGQWSCGHVIGAVTPC